MFGLTKKKPSFVRLDFVDHPVLGRLSPSDTVSGALVGSVTAADLTLCICVNPDGASLESALAFTAAAVSQFAELDARCRTLVADNFLTSYNSNRRFGAVAKADGTTEQFEKPLLTEPQFVASLTPTEIETTGAELLAVSYADGEIFWEHSICVTSFDGLKLTDVRIELQG